MRYLNKEKLGELLTKRTAEDMADGRIGGTGLCVMQNGEVIYKAYNGKWSYAEDIPLTDTELRFLIKTARNAGMDIYPYKDRIELYIPFSKAALLRIYAISVGDGKRIMLNKLNEIFFCGAPITITE